MEMVKKGFALSVLLMVATFSSAQFSFNAGVVSDYIFRGISQTEHDPAIQGGVDWNHESGFYLGSWASNVSFDSDSDIEVDLYGGATIPVTEQLSFDVGYIRYEYVDGESADDAYFGVTFDNVNFKYSHGFEIKWDYLEGSYDVSLPEDFGLTFHLGHTEFSDGEPKDYNDWKVGISKTWKGLDWEVAFVDTNWDSDITNAKLYLSILKSW
jgi:uncharacterized protein (TIGR02001 family)